MKKILIILMIIIIPFFNGCNPEEESLGESNISIETPELNSIDIWIRENFTKPFNIDVIYKWNENLVDFNRFLAPPDPNNIISAMEVVKTIWLDSYVEVAGSEFVKRIAPREILTIGGVNRNESGTVTLGLAEAGTRITFFETDLLDTTNEASVVQYVRTIQHEYVHIINQTVPFDEIVFGNVSDNAYKSDWFNSSIGEAVELGFITRYARSNVSEDFAEVAATILTRSAANYQIYLDGIRASVISEGISSEIRDFRSQNGRNPTPAETQEITDRVTTEKTPVADKGIALIKSKERLVAEYYKSELGIDIYELQGVVGENIVKVIN